MNRIEKTLVIFLFIALVGLFLAALANAQTWHTANQVTLEWDAVTLIDLDGTPLPADNTVEYEVFSANAMDPDKTGAISLGKTTATQRIITLDVEGSFFLGVKAFRKIADGTVVGESEVAWSDNPMYAQNGVPFGVRYFLPPVAPMNLRPVLP